MLDEKSIRLRKQILDVVNYSRRGHIGSAFSIVEIIRVLYDDILKYKVDNPFWEDRDRFILSKGHGCLALYVMFAEKGFFDKEELKKFCREDGILGGHPEYGKIPGVEFSTGALGHALSFGIGVAIAGKLDKKDYRVFVLIGDGECQEGSVWEGAMCAVKHNLDNLIVIVDYNKKQAYGDINYVQKLEPFIDKWRSFGWEVEEVDGHNIEKLREVLRRFPFKKEKPSLIIAHTVKGKGIPLIEKDSSWHHKSRISDEIMERLYKGLGL